MVGVGIMVGITGVGTIGDGIDGTDGAITTGGGTMGGITGVGTTVGIIGVMGIIMDHDTEIIMPSITTDITAEETHHIAQVEEVTVLHQITQQV